MAAPGATVAITGITTSNAQVLAADPSRSSVTFHNPNVSGTNANNSIIVCQASDTSGSAIAATFTSPAGGFVILAGAERTFKGSTVGLAWNAAASAGTTNVLSAWIEYSSGQ